MPGFQYTALGNSKSTTNIVVCTPGLPLELELYLLPSVLVALAAVPVSDCQASKQNYSAAALIFGGAGVTTFVWACSSFLKPLEHLKR